MSETACQRFLMSTELLERMLMMLYLEESVESMEACFWEELSCVLIAANISM